MQLGMLFQTLLALCLLATANADGPDKIVEIDRGKVGNSLVGRWRTSLETFELGFDSKEGATFKQSGHVSELPFGPFIATEAIISNEKNALLIVLRARNEKGEWQFRGFISISDIDEAGGSVVIVPYLDIIDADWEPDFDSIVDFQQSTRTIRLRKNAKAKRGEPTYKDVKLEEIQTRRRQDGERMDRRWEKLSQEARKANG